MASGRGAGYGADMLQDILKRKLVEAAQLAQQEQAAATLAEGKRRTDLGHDVSLRTLGQGDRRLALGEQQQGENVRQFDAQAPVRIANVRHLNASTDDLARKPQDAKDARTFTTERDTAQHGFRMEEGAQSGRNALAVANVRHPDPVSAAPTQKEQNEIEDSLAVIQQIRSDKALPTSTGPIQGRGVGAAYDLEGFTRVKALHDNLVNKLQLAQAGKLKGQGQISNMEREMLKNAATALDMKLGDGDYLNELGKVEAQFKRMLGTSGSSPAPGTTVDLVWDGTKFVKPGGGR